MSVERTLPIQVFEIMLAVTSQLSISPGGVHVALVHYSSPDQRTDVSFTLDIGVDYADVLRRVKAIDIRTILGISDLDL